MKYQNYYFKDFILDEPFQQWVLNPNPKTDLFWENWLQNNPGKQTDVARAKAAILELHLAGLRKEQAFGAKTLTLQAEPTPEAIQATWQSIKQAIKEPFPTQSDVVTEPVAKVIPLFSYKNWAKIAASIIILLAVGLAFWLKQKPGASPEYITYATAFGETKELTLPDNSKIFLNANSRLTTRKNWSSDSDREVKLSGEAFFSVVHTSNHQKFKVTLPKGVQVEVLGTEFTVTERPALSRVVLNKGKVQVKVSSGSSSNASHKEPASTVMAPGDLVEIDALHGNLTKSKVTNPEYFSAFTKNVIEFNNSPLSEVARVLQDNYGYKVTFVPSSLANKRFTSSNPSNRIDLLLFAIEKSFNLKVIQKGKQITIKAK